MGDEAAAVATVFDQPEILGARRLVSEYNFRLEGIMTTIHVWIYKGVHGDWVEADQNYYLQAPGMVEPAVPDSARYASVEEALSEVMASFIDGYRAAVQAGHEPSSDWLMPGF